MNRRHERLLLNAFTTLELVEELNSRIIKQIVGEAPGIGEKELLDETCRRAGALFDTPDDDLPPPVQWPG